MVLHEMVASTSSSPRLGQDNKAHCVDVGRQQAPDWLVMCGKESIYISIYAEDNRMAHDTNGFQKVAATE